MARPLVTSRGSRQGDPLSSYLFILCAEVLYAAIQHHVDTGSLKGIQVTRRAPKISHLMYADNTILSGTSSIPKMQLIKQVLAKYEAQIG